MENKEKEIKVTEAMILTALDAIAADVELQVGDNGEDVVTVTREDI